MSLSDKLSIVVAGTGPVGMIAALALSKAGFDVSLVGPDVRADDRRTTALMAPALDYLRELGVAERLEKEAGHLRTMRIVDATQRLIRAPVVTFRASEIGEEFFGLNIPNSRLNAVLSDAIAHHPGISRHMAMVAGWNIDDRQVTATLDDGTTVTASLAVAADGRGSSAREAAGIDIVSRRYDQSALVLTFAHEREHGDTSTEFHTESGPFTQVPLPGRHSSLVWVMRPARAEELSGMSDAALARLIEENMQSMLGKVTVQPGRQTYPLSSGMPRRFAQRRVALVGEAAHLFPPIGAQGLNLGIRDVQDLVLALGRHRLDPGSVDALSDFDRRRRPDILVRAGAVNLLNMSLLSPLLPAQMARSGGLALLNAVSPLRNLFMREGMRPGSGVRGFFEDLREQVRW